MKKSQFNENPELNDITPNISDVKDKGFIDVAEKIETRYRRAQTLMQGSAGTKKLVLNTMLTPRWIGDTDCFWYMRETFFGKSYRLVNAEKRLNQCAFNHTALAHSLEKESGETIDPENLPLTEVDIELSPRTVRFVAFGIAWSYDDHTKECQATDHSPANWKISPDGSKAVFARDYNLWLHDFTTGQERALTTDGAKDYVYGKTGGSLTHIFQIVDVLWSPDSTRIFTQVIDTRELNKWPPVMQYVPAGGSVTPTLLHTERRRSYFGDDNVEAWQLLTIEVSSAVCQRVDYKPRPVYYPFWFAYFSAGSAWWNKDSRHAYFVYQDLDGKNTQVLKLDSHLGTVREVFSDNPEKPIALIPQPHAKSPAIPLVQTNELIWYSDHSGWAHFYLYDLASGVLKNIITQGDWNVRGVLHVDPDARELIIQTMGRVKGRNPYYADICRVQIDTSELTELVSTDHEYLVFDRSSGWNAVDEKARSASPSGRYIVTTRARVNTLPESVLLDRNGQKLLTLETTDVSGMPLSWQWPEPVIVKGADGISDITGIVFRPTDFSADKSYPVLDYSSGHVEPLRAFSSMGGPEGYLSALAWAELGFIVVKFNNRGGDMRSAAFRDDKDPRLPKHGKADCVAAIKQLSQRYSYMDLDRVGVVDASYYPAALTGMLIYPDFYKVGVSLHPADSRFMGSMYRGWNGYPAYETFATNLRGKLLLTHGMLDDVISVAGTFRVIDALQQANKDFDMLLLPNVDYFGADYVLRRTWDYMVSHLLGAKPPENFELHFSSL